MQGNIRERQADIKPDIKLYSTDCPKCKMLKSKLDRAGIEYKVQDDINIMLAMGMQSVPILEVDNELLNYNDALRYIDGAEKERSG